MKTHYKVNQLNLEPLPSNIGAGLITPVVSSNKTPIGKLRKSSMIITSNVLTGDQNSRNFDMN